MQPATRKSLTLLMVGVGLWLVLVGPAYLLAGTRGIEGLAYAAALCTPVGCVVIFVAGRWNTQGAPLAALLLGMLARMGIVLGGVLALRVFRPDLRLVEFAIWVILFYIVTLAAETLLLLKGQPVSS
ncbi:MAG TPA: hypothetical protein VHI52_07185 [Verrucomicrobiae bacterium]|nr:hypothetical protein [Verrucomicrobiae bacterium]HVV99515.1 hypothetical protein [Planctomycetaceae bacterium]